MHLLDTNSICYVLNPCSQNLFSVFAAQEIDSDMAMSYDTTCSMIDEFMQTALQGEPEEAAIVCQGIDVMVHAGSIHVYWIHDRFDVNTSKIGETFQEPKEKSTGCILIAIFSRIR